MKVKILAQFAVEVKILELSEILEGAQLRMIPGFSVTSVAIGPIYSAYVRVNTL